MSVLFIKPSNSSFVRIDEEILQRHFPLKVFQLENKSKAGYFISLLKMKLFMIRKLRSYRLVFTRFADYHSALMVFMARLLGKKSVVVIGGYDVYHIPEFAYGAYHKKLRALCSRYVLNNADMLLPNSNALIFSENSYALNRTIYAGIRYYAPETKAKIQLLYNGFKSENWPYGEKKDKMVVSVAYMNDMVTYNMKGMDDFIQAARDMPFVPFVFVGVTENFRATHLNEIPSNLKLVPSLPNAELSGWYGRAKVFCILSLSEGMPNALCEAMLCGCIPVGSDVEPIPEIIGDTGFIARKKNREQIAEALQAALEGPDDLGKKARQRVIQEFSFRKREEGLEGILKGMLG
jgi:glycosyltransferase involved in cell wall biosynthesis